MPVPSKNTTITTIWNLSRVSVRNKANQSYYSSDASNGITMRVFETLDIDYMYMLVLADTTTVTRLEGGTIDHSHSYQSYNFNRSNLPDYTSITISSSDSNIVSISDYIASSQVVGYKLQANNTGAATIIITFTYTKPKRVMDSKGIHTYDYSSSLSVRIPIQVWSLSSSYKFTDGNGIPHTLDLKANFSSYFNGGGFYPNTEYLGIRSDDTNLMDTHYRVNGGVIRAANYPTLKGFNVCTTKSPGDTWTDFGLLITSAFFDSTYPSGGTMSFNVYYTGTYESVYFKVEFHFPNIRNAEDGDGNGHNVTKPRIITDTGTASNRISNVKYNNINSSYSDNQWYLASFSDAWRTDSSLSEASFPIPVTNTSGNTDYDSTPSVKKLSIGNISIKWDDTQAISNYTNSTYSSQVYSSGLGVLVYSNHTKYECCMMQSGAAGPNNLSAPLKMQE